VCYNVIACLIRLFNAADPDFFRRRPPMPDNYDLLLDAAARAAIWKRGMSVM
jgi:hypothetical protein